MDKNKIIELLKDYNPEEVNKFASYCLRIKLEKKRNSQELKNIWVQKKTSENMAELYKRVANEWLIFDWVHITLQSTWISYDYVALKNKMLLVYPESLIDIQLVYKEDEVHFSKNNWEVIYSHWISDPFNQKEDDILWWYVVIKNKRWQFLTTLNKEDIKKHRAVAKTDYIWKAWFKEMILKTLIKKACKMHFSDVFEKILEEDNQENDIEWGTEKINKEISENKEKEVLNKYNQK